MEQVHPVRSVSYSSNFIFHRHTSIWSVTRRAAHLLVIPLSFAAGFCAIWFQFFHIRPSGPKGESRGGGARNVATALMFAGGAASTAALAHAASLPTQPSLATAGGTFPQFSTSGNILFGYTVGSSILPMSMYSMNFGSVSRISLSDLTNAGFTALEGTGYYNPTDSGAPLNDPSTYTLQAWHNSIETNQVPPITRWLNNGTGIAVISNDAGIGQNGSEYTAASTWANNSVADWANILYGLEPGIVYDIGVDEAQTATGSGWHTIMSAYLNQPHVVFGQDPLQGNAYQYDWLSDSTISDFGQFETGAAGGSSTAGYLSDDTSAGYYLNNVLTGTNTSTPDNANRPVRSIPGVLIGSCTGVWYNKNSTSTGSFSNFVPGVDAAIVGGMSPGRTMDSIMYLLPGNFAAVRVYVNDTAPLFAPGRHVATQGAQQLQTGCSPVDAYNSANNYAIGQDRWYAMAAAFNVLKFLQPYVLQPTMAAPACNSPVVCGARQGNGGKLVTFINYSDNSNSVTFNPSAYYYGAGTTGQSWKIIGADTYSTYTDSNGKPIPSCGPEATLPSGSDCGTGFTTINGVDWTSTSTALPAAGAAPTTTTTLNMAPTEVDVFLYHP